MKKYSIGRNTKVWEDVQIREGAKIGNHCVLGKGVYIDRDVVIGDRCKIENYACIYRGTVIGNEVFIGPHACLLNDKYPRATNLGGSPKGDGDWVCEPVSVCFGASIGAGAVILPGVTIGTCAMVAAGSVVTKDVGEFHTHIKGKNRRQRRPI